MQHLKSINEKGNETTHPISANRIYNVLSSATFEKWYNKDYMDHIEGDEKAKDKAQILYDIEHMFK